MDERTAGELNMAFVVPYRHSAASGFALEGDVCAMAGLLGVPAESLTGKDFGQLLAPESGAQLLEKKAAQLKSGQAELFLPLQNAEGEVRWYLDRGRTVTAGDGSVSVEGVLVEADATYRRLAAEHAQVEQYCEKLRQTENVMDFLRERAQQDSLTGLLNARTTRNMVEDYLAAREAPCAMMVIDVDNFKRVNDSYGHMAGDKVMTGAANAIKKLFRANDIVGRIGGDEFLVLMKDVTKLDIARTRCQQIVQGFRQVDCAELQGDSLSCSVGAVFSTVPGCNYNQLLCGADQAMYRAKTAGGDQFCIEVV